jgi:hypothetical protein
MSRRRLLAILFALICLIAILLLAINVYLQAGAENPENLTGDIPLETEPPTEDLNSGDGNLFVIPESPIGTVGLVAASAIAFGLFMLLNKRKA